MDDHKPRPAAIFALSLLTVTLSVSCGPARHPTPRVSETGAPRSDHPAPFSEGQSLEGQSARGYSAPQPIAAAGDTGFGFLDAFTAELRAGRIRSPGALAVLPPFHVNRLFRRHEVSPLGEDLARRVLEGLRPIGEERRIVSPLAFE